MKLKLFVFGKVPKWIDGGIAEYLKRIPELSVVVVANNPSKTRVERMFQMVGNRSFTIVLDKAGVSWTSEELANQYARWRSLGQDICFLVGDDQGFSKTDLARANEIWALSDLTFPHAIARLIVCEQLYRAKSIYSGHSYHRYEFNSKK